jgi:hypothetical protein
MRRGGAWRFVVLGGLFWAVTGCRDAPAPESVSAEGTAERPAPDAPVERAAAEPAPTLPEPAPNVPWVPPTTPEVEPVEGGQWFGPASGLRRCWPDRLTSTPCPALRALRERVRGASDPAQRADLLRVLLGWLHADAAALRHAASWSLATDFRPTAEERTPARLTAVLAALGRETDAIAALSHAALAARWWPDARAGNTAALLGLLADRSYRWPGVRAQLAVRAQPADPRVAATLRRLSLDSEEGLRVRRAAVSSLRRMPEDSPTRPALEALLVEALKADAAAVAGAAAEVLGHAGAHYPEVAAAIRERAAQPGFGYDAGQGLVGFLRADPARPDALALAKALLEPVGIDGARKRPALEAAAIVGSEAAWALIATHANGADEALSARARALLASRGEGGR